MISRISLHNIDREIVLISPGHAEVSAAAAALGDEITRNIRYCQIKKEIYKHWVMIQPKPQKIYKAY